MASLKIFSFRKTHFELWWTSKLDSFDNFDGNGNFVVDFGNFDVGQFLADLGLVARRIPDFAVGAKILSIVYRQA